MALWVVALTPLLGAQRARAEGCVNGVCHQKLRHKAKFVHGPIGTGECKVCHRPRVPGVKGPSHRKGQMSVPSKTHKLCIKCHSRIAKHLAGAHKHRPVDKLDCTFCHDPHSSDLRYLLRKTRRHKRGRAPCFGCHSQRGFREPQRHKPLATGPCSQCHQAHGSKNPKLLVKPRGALCRNCHKVQWHKRKVVHGPVASGMCAGCHPPHSAKHPKLLSHPRKKICLKCHQTSRVDTLHGAVKGYGPDCLGCHDAHGTNKPHLLK